MSERNTAEVLSDYNREFEFCSDNEEGIKTLVALELDSGDVFPLSEVEEIGEALNAVRTRITVFDADTYIEWVILEE